MKAIIWAICVILGVSAPAMWADGTMSLTTVVRTTGHGAMDRMLSSLAGGRQGRSVKVVGKEDRIALLYEQNGQLIDLKQAQVVRLNHSRKQYWTSSFAEMRTELKKARESFESFSPNTVEPGPATAFGPDPLGDQAYISKRKMPEFEFRVERTDTGQKRQLGPVEVLEVKVVVTGWKKGADADVSDGVVLTTSLWIGDVGFSVDDWRPTYDRFCRIVIDQPCFGLDVDLANLLSLMIPEFPRAATLLASELRKLDRPVLSSTSTLELVRSVEEVRKEEARRAKAEQSGGARILGDPPARRATVLTLEQEAGRLSRQAVDADLMIPQGFSAGKKRNW